MKIWFECNHTSEAIKPDEIEHRSFPESWMKAFCGECGEKRKIIKVEDSEADQATNTSRLAQ